MLYIQSVGSLKRHRINQAIPTPNISYDSRWPHGTTEITPTLAPLLTDTLDADSDEVASFQNVVPSTNVTTTSLIRVTALPPAKTLSEAVLPKLPYHRQMNVLYLIPLLIALGIVLGSITAAMFFKWRENRQHLLRTSVLLPGPPYAPPENDLEDRLLAHRYPSMEQVSLFAATTPSKFTVHGSRYAPPKRIFGWRTLDTTRLPQPTYSQSVIPSADGERFTVVTEQVPSFSTSPVVVRWPPKSQNDLSPLQTRVLPSLPDVSPRNGPDRPEAKQTHLPKPYRRSMFDVLGLKGPHRSTIGIHQKYTVPVLDHDPANENNSQVQLVSSPNATVLGDRCPPSAQISMDRNFHIGDTDDALKPLSPAVSLKQTYRLKEGMLSFPSQDERLDGPHRLVSSTLDSRMSPRTSICSEDELIYPCNVDKFEEEQYTDIYTKTPQRRHSRAPRRKGLNYGSARQSLTPDTHASVLPLSPPSLMSAPLEKSLFFTSSPSASTTLATIHSSHPYHMSTSPELSLFPLPSKKRNETKGLSQLAAPECSAPSDVKSQCVSPRSPQSKGSTTSAVQRESTMGIWSLGSLSPSSLAIALASSSSADMLGKVNDVVAISYTRKRASMGGAGVAGLADSV